MATASVQHNPMEAQAFAGAKAVPMTDDSGSGTGTATSTSDSATISANDFLTLLVTEMKNQDPTANTDPNEYINQLVQVNSLEQLININQTLSSAYPATTSSQDGSGSSHAIGATASPQPKTTAQGSIPDAIAQTVSAGTALPTNSGNLGVPAPSAAASRVAHALDGRRTSHSAVPGVSGLQ